MSHDRATAPTSGVHNEAKNNNAKEGGWKQKRQLTGVPDGTSGSDEYSTPAWLAKFLAELLDLDFDPATSTGNPNNRLFRRGFYSLGRGQDGLLLPWEGRIFCNPPYSDLLAWTTKAVASITQGSAEIVVMILPARMGTEWFFQNVYLCSFCQCIPLRDRVSFGGRASGGNFDSLIVVYRQPGAQLPVADERALSLSIGAARAAVMAKRKADRKVSSKAL